MAIVISCSACNVRLTLGDDRAGDRFECPQCDATIKVPAGEVPRAMPAQPPPRPIAEPRAPVPPPDDRSADPGERTDKRVRAGILAGVVALLLVGATLSLFALRKPQETAKAVAEPSTPVAEASAKPSAAPNPPALVAPEPKPEIKPPKLPIVPQPAPPAPELPATQYNAQFLGSQGQGRRFCIIADNSGSMSGAKIADLKKQLLKTLSDLNGEGEFYVYCFNSRTQPMPHPTWLKGSAPEAEAVRDWIGAVRASGGTLPVPAFEAAFKLNPPPDVIFFMTDGLIPADVPGRVVALNTLSPKVVVNTIMFATPPPKSGTAPKAAVAREEDLLKRIAEQNGGTFNRYVSKE